MLELMGTTEVAKVLGVSRQRAHQLAVRENFPRPLAVLAMGPVYDGGEVRAFAADRNRRPGRPASERKNGWCEWAARPITQKFHVQPDRDGEHPDEVKCKCGTQVTPIRMLASSDWFYPAHQRGGD